MRIGTFLAGATTLVIAAVTSVLVIGLAAQEHRRAMSDKGAAAAMVTDLCAASVSAGVVFEDVDAVKAELDNLRSTSDVIGAAIFRRSDALPMAAIGMPLPPRDEAGIEATDEWMSVTRPVFDRDGHTVAHVRVAFSLARENAAIRQTRRSLAGGGVVVIAAVVLLLTALTRRRLVRPLQRLAAVAERIQHGDLSARALEAGTGADEITSLASAFDDMGHAIAEREGRLRGELQVAADLQVSVLPKMTDVPTLDVSATMTPATEVGGDYYDIIPTARGCWIGIGDVSGHGLGAGVVMLMLQSAIAALVRSNPSVSPASVECTVNEVLYENIRQRMGRRDHATLTILRYESDGTIRFAGAHEDMIVYRAATGTIELIETPGTWVGAMTDIGPSTTESELALGKDDVLVLYTDGVTEAMRNRAQFGLDRLSAIVREVASRHEGTAQSIRDAIVAAVNAWADVTSDDVSVVVMRHKGAHAH